MNQFTSRALGSLQVHLVTYVLNNMTVMYFHVKLHVFVVVALDLHVWLKSIRIHCKKFTGHRSGDRAMKLID